MNFEYQNPTRIVFGAGKLSRLGGLACQYGEKALLVTGGGSVKRSGTFDRAVASLREAGVAVAECDGVEPNPQIRSVRRGAGVVREEGCEFVIALGGGSTMDAAKAIAAAALYEGEPWDLIAHGQARRVIPTEALPVIAVPTLAATGSEMNRNAVISNEEARLKSLVAADCLYPKVALVDPELTLTVPKKQTAYGVCDIIAHVTETYLNSAGGTPIQDHFAEGVILSTMKWGRRAVEEGSDLEARAQVQWASIVALNGWLQAGVATQGFPVHAIEHALSAHHGIAHGAGLAILNPAWMRFAARADPTRLVQLAERVFGLAPRAADDLDCALKGVDEYEAFLKSIGCPTRLSEVGIGEDLFEQYARDAARVARDGEGRLLSRPPMTQQDIIGVLKAAL